jgi:hypothetical protein
LRIEFVQGRAWALQIIISAAHFLWIVAAVAELSAVDAVSLALYLLEETAYCHVS